MDPAGPGARHRNVLMGRNQRYALITGGNRGLGLSSARVLARRGWSVLLGCRDPRAAEAALTELRGEGGTAHAVAVDVADPASIAAAARAVAGLTDRLHAVVNNAGLFSHREEHLPDLEPRTAVQMLLTNACGPLLVVQAFLPLLKAANGASVVNVTSEDANADTFDGEYTCYRMSKAALNAMTLNLAIALRPHDVLVNGVDPGWIPTDMGGAEAPGSITKAALAVADAVELADREKTGRTILAQ
ncbi:SDR family NAD(P)-dependent oxidoreductase [Saccharopolyspora hirsuta]|uniref:SDR family NAD(P)-dependent oxidoreductase n=1 Tax=Saccharopolyspora hirsuta TaxID=1837 RepID=A0A5M7C476_SACHI|nr:SDR family NAD(P)-dependent oxidoreductase [Saccharopolyspora hirsuta]KAA5835068.1 SDR family NAD(P)-dependent oxidoreductase [Saccharopolyspora hirsuta]